MASATLGRPTQQFDDVSAMATLNFLDAVACGEEPVVFRQVEARERPNVRVNPS